MLVSGQEGRGPSVAEIQRFIRDKQVVEFHLANGEKLSGRVRWFDESAFSIQSEDKPPITILRAAVMAYQAIQ
jgi:sRNA-binding regulator protein Hfq